MPMLGNGHDPVFNAKKQKSNNIPLQHSLRFVYQMHASILFMSIWLAH